MNYRLLTIRTLSSRLRPTRAWVLPAVLLSIAAACSSQSSSPSAQAQTGGAGAAVGGSGGAFAGGGATQTPVSGGAGTAGSAGRAGAANSGGGGLGGTLGSGGALAGTGGTAEIAGAGQAGTGGTPGPVCVVPNSGGVDFADLMKGPKDLQAESAMLTGLATATKFNNVDYVDMLGAEGSFLWLLDVPSDGQYSLTFTYTEMEGRDMGLVVNCTEVSASIPFGATGDWTSSWASDVSQLVTLRKGTNQIVLATNGGSGPNFDKVTVTPPTCQLSMAEAKPCEAEAALLQGSAAKATSGAVGYVDMVGAEGAIHWFVNAPVAGTYDVTFVYTEDDLRDMTVTVNGVKTVPSQPFAKTGSWTNGWVNDVHVQVELEAGSNTIVLSTNGGSGPNFDKVVVAFVAGAGGAGGAGGATL